MNSQKLYDMFKSKFDAVGIIETKTYREEAQKMDKNIPEINYPTMVVLGLAYPKRTIKHTHTHLVPSFYTFGKDYHVILKARMEEVVKDLDFTYELGVDNHPHDERLAAVLAGLGFYGKNQLIINPDYGTYLFLGLVFLDVKIDREIVLEINDDCGTCRKCIDACPTHALDHGYDVDKCMSHFNQSKRNLLDEEINANYSLFGCDICQMVCPKNINKGVKIHPEFVLSGKEAVSILDLFQDSEKVFKEKYKDMAYLWKGKTILMRNAVCLLYKHQNYAYNDLIETSLKKLSTPWYVDTVSRLLKRMNESNLTKKMT